MPWHAQLVTGNEITTTLLSTLSDFRRDTVELGAIEVHIPVADPECARGGGVSHILAEKGCYFHFIPQKCMKMQYFHQ